MPFFINGNSAKSPATPADRGGFTGWSLWGVDPVTPQEAQRVRRSWPAGGATWIAAEVRPHVDALQVRAPATAPVGAAVPVDAVLTQAGREVPVAYPVSADWTASPDVHIGPLWGLRPWHVAWFDPTTGTLLGLRAGTITLGVTVNGVTDQATVTLAAGAQTAGENATAGAEPRRPDGSPSPPNAAGRPERAGRHPARVPAGAACGQRGSGPTSDGSPPRRPARPRAGQRRGGRTPPAARR